MSKRILLAEDSSTIRKTFELAFAQSDVSLTMVDNGDDAVRIAMESAPDLVVADITLPGRDGFKVAEEILASGKVPSCPVLILSGTLIPFDEEKFRKSGARGVLFKPFECRELADKVHELLSEIEESRAEEKPQAAPVSAAPWDFSDVRDEAEKKGGPAAPGIQYKEDFLSGSPRGTQVPEGGLSLGEFDVSLDDIEKPRAAASPEPGGTAPAEPEPVESHIEGDIFADAPPAVTDIDSAIAAAEELEDIENLDEVDLLRKEAKDSRQEPATVTESEAREQFSARAQEIFEKVAAEALEKAMREFMERIAAEFSEKIRESVESVAWEVIPQAADALIREEIARIRERTEKKSS
ncbi:MAG TPA: response regulator [Anaerolineales bacterium]